MPTALAPRVRLAPFPPMMKKRALDAQRLHDARRNRRSPKPLPESRFAALVAARQAHWSTVSLAFRSSAWWLAYNDEPSTGPFRNKHTAIAWFMRGGR